MDEGRSVESSKIRPIIRTVVAVLLFLFYMLDRKSVGRERV